MAAETSFLFATPSTPTSLVAGTSAGWALDPLFSLDATVPSFVLSGAPYLNEAEEGRLMASLGVLPDPTALDCLLTGKPAPQQLPPCDNERHIAATLLHNLEMEAEEEPFGDYHYRAPPTGCSYDTVPIATIHAAAAAAAAANLHNSDSTTVRPTTAAVMAYDALSDVTLEDDELSAQAVPHSPDQSSDENDGARDSASGSGSSTPVRRRGSYSKTKRRYPRSHTCREPERAEFATEEEFQSAWNTWRQIRNCNNEAVRRSRNSKKAMLGCKNDSCTAMIKKLKAAEKIKELLLKAACAPHTLSRTESMAYNKLIASRAQFVALSAGSEAPTAPAAPVTPSPHPLPVAQ